MSIITQIWFSILSWFGVVVFGDKVDVLKVYYHSKIEVELEDVTEEMDSELYWRIEKWKLRNELARAGGGGREMSIEEFREELFYKNEKKKLREEMLRPAER